MRPQSGDQGRSWTGGFLFSVLLLAGGGLGALAWFLLGDGQRAALQGSGDVVMATESAGEPESRGEPNGLGERIADANVTLGQSGSQENGEPASQEDAAILALLESLGRAAGVGDAKEADRCLRALVGEPRSMERVLELLAERRLGALADAIAQRRGAGAPAAEEALRRLAVAGEDELDRFRVEYGVESRGRSATPKEMGALVAIPVAAVGYRFDRAEVREHFGFADVAGDDFVWSALAVIPACQSPMRELLVDALAEARSDEPVQEGVDASLGAGLGPYLLSSVDEPTIDRLIFEYPELEELLLRLKRHIGGRAGLLVARDRLLDGGDDLDAEAIDDLLADLFRSDVPPEMICDMVEELIRSPDSARKLRAGLARAIGRQAPIELALPMLCELAGESGRRNRSIAMYTTAVNELALRPGAADLCYQSYADIERSQETEAERRVMVRGMGIDDRERLLGVVLEDPSPAVQRDAIDAWSWACKEPTPAEVDRLARLVGEGQVDRDVAAIVYGNLAWNAKQGGGGDALQQVVDSWSAHMEEIVADPGSAGLAPETLAGSLRRLRGFLTAQEFAARFPGFVDDGD